VRSGRLGLSLGLDLLGDAICSFDCVYCEVGPTRVLTIRRAAYVPARDILDELSRWWEGVGSDPAGRPDVITLGGQGEPCLNSEIGEIIAGARRIAPGVPVAVLTNSAHLADPAVRRDLAGADLVLPSLDTLVPREMARLNRAHAGLTPQALRDGLLALRAEFAGHIYLEVLLAEGYNDSAENLALLREFIPRLRPDRVDVVTLSRPGTLPGVRPVSAAVLEAWRAALGGPGEEGGTGLTRLLHQEAAPQGAAADEPGPGAADLVLASALRRPQTAEQLASALRLPLPRVVEILEALARQGKLAEIRLEGGTYYSAQKR
jgi:wyosine [tRNA(Phe)-imidazoG37] synthetase (radical SAM superfamily)